MTQAHFDTKREENPSYKFGRRTSTRRSSLTFTFISGSIHINEIDHRNGNNSSVDVLTVNILILCLSVSLFLCLSHRGVV